MYLMLNQLQEVTIKTSDGFELDTAYYKADGDKIVIFAHGMTVDKDDEGIFIRAGDYLHADDFSTLRFDFRAHGKSSGDSAKDFTISGELHDLETVVQWVRKQGYREIHLARASFGGSIVALYAGKYPHLPVSIFLANPVLDYQKAFLNPTTPWAQENFQDTTKKVKQKGYIEIGSRNFKAGKSLFDEMTRFSPCEDLQKYSRPTLIVHGTHDTKVALEGVRDCYNQLPNTQKQLEIIEHATHGFHAEPFETDVVNLLVDFFLEQWIYRIVPINCRKKRTLL